MYKRDFYSPFRLYAVSYTHLLTTLKFFPANIYGGLKALKALSAPFPQVRFIPTGGVNKENMEEYLAYEKVAAVGGSFFVEEALRK